METLSKITIYIGIAVGISFFALFMIIALPHMIQDSGRQWEETFGSKKSSEEIKYLFYHTESYKAFLENYPNAGEYYRYQGNGEGRMEITAMNFETFNTLLLELNFNRYDESVYEEISCFNHANDIRHQVRGTITKQFIEESKCLDGDGIIASPSPLVDANGKPIPYMCGPDAHYDSSNDVCIIIEKPIQ